MTMDDVLFDEFEAQILEAYVFVLFGHSDYGNKTIGRILAAPTSSDNLKTFAKAIFGLKKIYESQRVPEEIQNLYLNIKVQIHPVLGIVLAYLIENRLVEQANAPLNSFAQTYLTGATALEPRIHQANTFLLELIISEFGWQYYPCPVCQLKIPKQCILTTGETNCARCDTKFLYDSQSDSLIVPLSKAEQVIPIPEKSLDVLADEAHGPIEQADVALSLYMDGKIPRALSLLDEAVTNTDELAVMSIGARIYFEVSDFEKAAKCLEKLVDENSDDVSLLGLLAQSYMEIGLYQEAIARLERILELEPDNEIARGLIARIKTQNTSSW